MLSIHGIKIAALPCDTVVTFFSIWVCTFGLHVRVLFMLGMMFVIHVPSPILFHKNY